MEEKFTVINDSLLNGNVKFVSELISNNGSVLSQEFESFVQHYSNSLSKAEINNLYHGFNRIDGELVHNSVSFRWSDEKNNTIQTIGYVFDNISKHLLSIEFINYKDMKWTKKFDKDGSSIVRDIPPGMSPPPPPLKGGKTILPPREGSFFGAEVQVTLELLEILARASPLNP